MIHARDAHGITSWKNRYIIVVGSWHVESSRKTCEIYDTKKNTWTELPSLNDETCAPGLVIVKDRFLYKLGGATDVGKVEVLDLSSINFGENNDKSCLIHSDSLSNTSDAKMSSSDESQEEFKWVTI